MPSLANYTPEDVNVLIAGLVSLEGFVDGTFINIVKDITPYTTIRTPDGTTARKYNASFSYTITLSLFSGSGSNELLTRLMAADQLTQKGKFPLLIKDNSGTSLFFGSTCWIESPPELSFSNNFDTRTWVIRAMGSTVNFGGNEDVSDLIDNLVDAFIGAIPALRGIV